jgi:hypothetical protein
VNEKSRPEGRPFENVAAAAKLQVGSASDCTAITDRTVINGAFPLNWARQLIESADGPVPEYGSREWLRLPDESRTKVAACVAAAERWRIGISTPWTSFAPANATRRRIEEARRPRPGDHPGGPVPWDRDEVVGGE